MKTTHFLKFRTSFKTLSILGALLFQQMAFSVETPNSQALYSAFKATFGELYEIFLPEKEAQAEAVSFFSYNAEENSKIIKSMYLSMESVVAVSMGSSSTQYYWLEGEKLLSGSLPFLGTDDFTAPKPNSLAKISEFFSEKHIAKFAGTGRQIVFFNSIGYAPNKELAYYWMLNGQTEEGLKNIFTEGTDSFPQFILETIKTTELQTFVKNRDMKPKFDNAWALILAQSNKHIKFIVDIGGGSATIREIIRDEDGNPVKAESVRKIKIKANNIIKMDKPAEFKVAVGEFVNAIKKGLAEVGATSENSMIRQTGQIRAYLPEVLETLRTTEAATALPTIADAE